MNSRLPARGLYAITDGRQGAPLYAAVRAVLEGGAVLLQYRDKTPEHSRRLREARELLKLCRAFAVPLIINDDVALCGEVGADGVHLGFTDVAPAAARAALGATSIIGVSCYNRLPEPAHAEQADYLGFGAFYLSATKPQAPHAELSVLETAQAAYPQQRLAAIGGINARNGLPLSAAGAHYLAAVGAVFDAGDIAAAARTIAALFKPQPA